MSWFLLLVFQIYWNKFQDIHCYEFVLNFFSHCYRSASNKQLQVDYIFHVHFKRNIKIVYCIVLDHKLVFYSYNKIKITRVLIFYKFCLVSTCRRCVKFILYIFIFYNFFFFSLDTNISKTVTRNYHHLLRKIIVTGYIF